MHTILKMMMTMQLNPTHLTLSTRVAASTHCIKNTTFVQLITIKTYINFLFNFRWKMSYKKWWIVKKNVFLWMPIFGLEMDLQHSVFAYSGHGRIGTLIQASKKLQLQMRSHRAAAFDGKIPINQKTADPRERDKLIWNSF